MSVFNRMFLSSFIWNWWCSVTSIKMGEGEHNKEEDLLGCRFSMILMASMLITTVFLLFNAPFLRLFGASNEILSFANEFLNI
ncbi:hypothetical protein [Paenibacillus sp. 276b]|uniref:hypothetical protein n=1 Tax=Paenibacillus sp. 276b TaxID=1566277 RepID=UPI001C40AA3A|nr:hypothetical protein [Paenibacillus sp. 276b]